MHGVGVGGNLEEYCCTLTHPGVSPRMGPGHLIVRMRTLLTTSGFSSWARNEASFMGLKGCIAHWSLLLP